MTNYNILAVIPARGGSKGIPGKNIHPLCGLPLIAYTIKSGMSSRLISHLIVSTEDQKIAEIAKDYGVEVPFLRPAELATDFAMSVDVMKHAISVEEERLSCRFDYVVMLQPTSPLKTSEDIDKVIEKLILTQCDTVVSVVDVGAKHPDRMYKIEDERLVRILDEGPPMRPRQELPHVYILNGAVYAFRRNVIDDYGSLLGGDIRPFVMPPERSANIDEPVDLLIAEDLINQRSTAFR